MNSDHKDTCSHVNKCFKCGAGICTWCAVQRRTWNWPKLYCYSCYRKHIFETTGKII